MATPISPSVATADKDPERSRRGRLIGLAACSALLLVCGALVFRYLFQYGVSNIGRIDGSSQNFPAFVYVHDWFTAVLSGHGGDFGMWSWRLGLGSDTLGSLSYYVADPFALIALLFPAHLLEYVYEALLFLRILCAGLAGYLYMRTMRATRFAAAAGALVYVFTVYMLRMTVLHPYFANPMIWLPLILIGTERVLAGRRWYLLVGALFLAAASNFYTFYQVAIITVLYAVARWLEVTPRGRRLRALARDGLRVAGFYVLGAALAAVVLVPVVMSVLASSRETTPYATPLFYSVRTYLTEWVALISARAGANGFYAGFAPLALLAAAVVFLRRGNLALKTMLGALLVFAVFPFFGRMLNGFAYANYRAYFAAGIFLGAAVAIVLSDPSPLSRRELKWTGAGFGLFSLIDVAACWVLGYPLILVLVPIGLGVLSWGLLAAERRIVDRAGVAGDGAGERAPKRLMLLRAGMVGILILGVAALGVASYDEHFNPALKGYLPLGSLLPRFQKDAGSQVKTLPFDGLQRTDKQNGVVLSDLEASQTNDPLIQGFAGLDFYYSLMNDSIHEYSKSVADRAKRLAFDIEGFDDRAALDTLAAVRYYIAPPEGAGFVPYGFTASSKIGSETVYENRYALPVGYVYHSAIAPDAYDAMSPLDRQQALLQGVVVADGVAPAVPRAVPAPETVEVTYTLTPGKGLSWDLGAKRIVVKNGSYADLRFAPVPDAEVYVEMKGLTFTSPRQLTVAVQGDGPRKVDRVMAQARPYFWGEEAVLVNLGYHANGLTKARVIFLNKDTVGYTSLRVIAVPMARYAQHVGGLAAEGMQGVRVGADSLGGTVTAHGDGVLFLSIPYGSGWSATVDGVATEIVKANVGFSGIAVSDGTHRVELRYRTPGLDTGIIVTALALLLAIALAVATERRLASAHTRRAGDEPPVQDR